MSGVDTNTLTDPATLSREEPVEDVFKDFSASGATPCIVATARSSFRTITGFCYKRLYARKRGSDFGYTTEIASGYNNQ